MGNRKPVFLMAGSPGVKLDKPDPLLRALFAATGAATPTVAYIGVACSDDRSFFTWLSRYFQKSGAGGITLAPTVRRFDRRAFEKTCIDADTVFISGGDVEEGMAVAAKRKIIPFLGELYRGGKLFWGLSAGSIMLARQWVRWTDEEDEDSSELFPCLGFARVLCDTHGEADHWDELKALLKLKPDKTIGYGIRSFSGLRVDPDGSAVPLGKVDVFVKSDGKVKRV